MIFLPGRTRPASAALLPAAAGSAVPPPVRAGNPAMPDCAGLSRCARIPLRRPNSRAGSTRVSLKTTRSEARSSAGNSPKTVSRSSSPCICNIRDAARSAGGCCAISSGGSGKSKSETSTKMIIGPTEIDQRYHRKCGEAPQATVLCGRREISHWIDLAMSEHESRLEILRFGKMLHERGLIAATDGNISVRLNEVSVLITPTCISKGMMSTEDLLVVDMQWPQDLGLPRRHQRNWHAHDHLPHASGRERRRACASAHCHRLCRLWTRP